MTQRLADFGLVGHPGERRAFKSKTVFGPLCCVMWASRIFTHGFPSAEANGRAALGVNKVWQMSSSAQTCVLLLLLVLF